MDMLPDRSMEILRIDKLLYLLVLLIHALEIVQDGLALRVVKGCCMIRLWVHDTELIGAHAAKRLLIRSHLFSHEVLPLMNEAAMRTKSRSGQRAGGSAL